jgi:hypothetical protein
VYYLLAELFSRRFEEQFAELKKINAKGGDCVDENRVPTVDEKIKFSYNVYKITGEELGRVVDIIKTKCPAALVEVPPLLYHHR